MKSAQKTLGLMSTLAKAMLYHAQTRSAKQLGDRTTYIGLSDISKGIECQRSAVAGKIVPSELTYDVLNELNLLGNLDELMKHLRKQLVLQRGHWFENAIVNILQNFALKLIPQLEIEVEYQGVPIKAHLDITLIWSGSKPAIRILELKSNERINNVLYSSYETQIAGQISLLYKSWNKPCFNLRDDAGNLYLSHQTFPQIAQNLFNINLPENPDLVDMEAWVLAISMSDIHAYGPYAPDEAMLSVCFNTAKQIWQQVQEVKQGKIHLNDTKYCKSFHPLCDFCNHNADCPKFSSINSWQVPEIERDIAFLSSLKTSKKALEADIEELENRIMQHYKRTITTCSDSKIGDWINAGNHRCKVSQQAGRTSIDKETLASELLILNNGDVQTVEKILSHSTKVSGGYERLWISPINENPKKQTKAAIQAA